MISDPVKEIKSSTHLDAALKVWWSQAPTQGSSLSGKFTSMKSKNKILSTPQSFLVSSLFNLN
jgi:hypothetical protein